METETVEVKEEPTGRAPGITTRCATVLVIVVSLISSVSTIAVYDRWFAQKVVAVNISEFVQGQRDLVLAKKITLDEFKVNLSRYIAALKSQPKNKVLILEDVIASKNLERIGQ